MYEVKATDGRLFYMAEPGERLFVCSKCRCNTISTKTKLSEKGWKFGDSLLGIADVEICKECWETKKILFRKRFK